MLQEAVLGRVPSTGLTGWFGGSWSYPWPGGATVGLATFARLEALRVSRLPTRWREFWVTAPKLSLATTLVLPGGSELLAINVHLLNFERFSRFRFSEQLADIERRVREHPGPVIVAGDWNTWSERRLELVGAMSSQLSLSEVDGFRSARRTGDLGAGWNWLLGIDAELPLDRVYVRGLRPLETRVLHDQASDHPPLLVRLELTAGASL